MNNLPVVVALDVDGVLNTLNRMSDREVYPVVLEKRHATPLSNPHAIGRELHLRFDPENDRKFINQLHALGTHVVWCTTWEQAANELLCPLLGVEPFDVLAISDWTHPDYPSAGLAKAEGLAETFPNQAVCWIDDDNDFWETFNKPHPSHYTCTTNPKVGLTPQLRENVLGWVSKHNQVKHTPSGGKPVVYRRNGFFSER